MSLFGDLRKTYHQKICSQILGYRSEKGSKWLSVADKSSKTSKLLAERLAHRLGYPLCDEPPVGQRAGALFTQFTCEFLEAAFTRLHHLRPGKWEFSVSQQSPGIARYEQYEHLAELEKLAVKYEEVRSFLGQDYLITPDLVVLRHPVTDEEINAVELLVSPEDRIARYTPLRIVGKESRKPILHASISCKWSIRSDRAQNTRTEALNLIRNRKGKTPHIVAVTLEPLPTRLASLAMGTGDIDCVYHGALYEMLEVLTGDEVESERDMLLTLVNGKRLRDISDLPFDLAI